MEKLEKDFLKEIKPLVNEYLTSKEIPGVYNWRDTRVQEEIKKEYSNDLEGELLQEIDETRDPETRRKLIDQLSGLRENRQQQLDKDINERVNQFKEEYKQKITNEIENRQQEIDTFEEERKKIVQERIKYIKLKKEFGKDSKVYKAASEEEKEVAKKIRQVFGEVKALEEEIKDYKTDLQRFDEVYGTMDFSNHSYMETLKIAIANMEEQETDRISDGRIIINGAEMHNPTVGEILDITERKEQKGTKPEGIKPEVTKPEGTKPEGTKPEGTKPEGTKPEGTKPEVTKPESNKANIRIYYKANLDKYLITNKDTNESYVRKYGDIQPISIDEIMDKYELRDSSFIEGIDPTIVSLLEEFDENNGTSKTKEYIENVTTIGRSKEERKQDMEEDSIDIKYNLIGLFDKKVGFSKADREDILKVANIAKNNGIATVKKGIKTTLMEFMGNVTSKFSNIKLPSIKIPRLTSGKNKQSKESNLLDDEKLDLAAQKAIERSNLTNKYHSKVDEGKAIKATEEMQQEEQEEVQEEI